MNLGLQNVFYNNIKLTRVQGQCIFQSAAFLIAKRQIFWLKNTFFAFDSWLSWLKNSRNKILLLPNGSFSPLDIINRPKTRPFTVKILNSMVNNGQNTKFFTQNYPFEAIGYFSPIIAPFNTGHFGVLI